MKKLIILLLLITASVYSQNPKVDALQFKPQNAPASPKKGWVHMDNNTDLFKYDGSRWDKINKNSDPLRMSGINGVTVKNVNNITFKNAEVKVGEYGTSNAEVSIPIVSESQEGILPAGFIQSGEFTPTLNGYGYTYTYKVAHATYYRIGKLVHFKILFSDIESTGTQSDGGGIYISSLPFSAKYNQGVNVFDFGGTDAKFYSIIGAFAGGKISFTYQDELDGELKSHMPEPYIKDGSIWVSGVYESY